MSAATNLRSCPFCGSGAKITGEGDMLWIRCANDNCKAQRTCKFDELYEATKDWNERV